MATKPRIYYTTIGQQMAYDEGEHVKDVFAYFGRAYYQAEVMETGIAIALMQIDFLGRLRDQYLNNLGKSFDRVQYEADFDLFRKNQHAQTLGNLIKRLSAIPELSGHLKERLSVDKTRREFLGNHYFRERAVGFTNHIGRDKMISELNNDASLFEWIDQDIYAELASIHDKLGMNSEHFRTYIKQFYATHGVDSLTE